MLYNNTCIESVTAVLPETIISSREIEDRLAPLYRRLRLPEGRLELMTGIKERRHWDEGCKPSQAAAKAGEKAMSQAGVATEQIEAVFNCSVSRDFIEPATSTAVHRLLGLPGHSLNFDISNACLGILSGMVTLAGLIESGQIKRGLLVAAENGRPLMENTISALNENHNLSRRDIKPMFASLTIGSAAIGLVMTEKSVTQSGHFLLGGSHLCDSRFNDLCQGDQDNAMEQKRGPLMQTDSEELLVQGVKVAERNWELCKRELGWDNETPDFICTHQVGRIHRQRLYERLKLNPNKDFATVESLGNCGSASLPATLALAIEQGHLLPGDKAALLGIGSGINCQMLGLQW